MVHSDVSIQQEILYIREWAEKNKMSINMSKTKKIVFHRPHPSKYSLPNILSNVERVLVVNLLGIYLMDTLRAGCTNLT